MQAVTPGAFEYSPDYAVPPGETLLDVLDERGMTQAELARRTDLSAKHINQIVKGHAPISNDVALRIERVTGVPARIWLNLESGYQERRARLADDAALEGDLALLDEFARCCDGETRALDQAQQAGRSYSGGVEFAGGRQPVSMERDLGWSPGFLPYVQGPHSRYRGRCRLVKTRGNRGGDDCL